MTAFYEVDDATANRLGEFETIDEARALLSAVLRESGPEAASTLSVLSHTSTGPTRTSTTSRRCSKARTSSPRLLADRPLRTVAAVPLGQGKHYDWNDAAGLGRPQHVRVAARHDARRVIRRSHAGSVEANKSVAIRAKELANDLRHHTVTPSTRPEL